MSVPDDPFLVLGVKHKDDLQKIREQFKKLVLIHHPDRGGKVEDFDLIKKSYSLIYDFKKRQDVQKKKQNRTLEELQMERNIGISQKRMHNDLANDLTKFNRLFEENRQEDVYSNDRSSILSVTSNAPKTQIAIVDQPDPIHRSFTCNKRELGVDEVKDYSTYCMSSSSSIGDNKSRVPQCTDLAFAYRDQEFLENMGNSRKTTHYKTPQQLQQYCSERNKVCRTSNPRDKQLHSMREEHQRNQEEKRLYNMHARDRLLARQFSLDGRHQLTR